MPIFLLNRLLQASGVLVSVAFLAFLLFQYVGDPVIFLLGQDATPQQIRELRSALGLDQSFLVQFQHFLGNAIQGEFGISLRQGTKVSKLIAERLPATLELATIAALLALAAGIPMGVYAALRAGRFSTQVLMTISLLGGVTPNVSDRHPADPAFFGQPGLVAELWSRRHAPIRLVEHGPAERRRLEAHRSTRHNPGDFSAHAHHAPCARGDARGAPD